MSAANDGKSGAIESASASAASFADWISVPLRGPHGHLLAAVELDRPLSDCRGARVDRHDIGELVVLQRQEHRHQLRQRCDRPLGVSVRGRRGSRPSGVLDEVAPRPDRRRARPRAVAGSKQRRQESGHREQEPHLSRILSPMKSDVECTFGLSRTSVATGTPDFVEITANVSPARTSPETLAGDRRVVVVRHDVLPGGRGCGRRVCCPPPDSMPERIEHDGDRRREEKRSRSEYRRQSSGITTNRRQPRSPV